MTDLNELLLDGSAPIVFSPGGDRYHATTPQTSQDGSLLCGGTKLKRRIFASSEFALNPFTRNGSKKYYPCRKCFG